MLTAKNNVVTKIFLSPLGRGIGEWTTNRLRGRKRSSRDKATTTFHPTLILLYYRHCPQHSLVMHTDVSVMYDAWWRRDRGRLIDLSSLSLSVNVTWQWNETETTSRRFLTCWKKTSATGALPEGRIKGVREDWWKVVLCILTIQCEADMASGKW